MAKKLFGKKKAKKAAEPTKPVEGQPILTQLSSLPADSPLRKRLSKAKPGGLADMTTILGYDPRQGGMLG